MGVILAGTYPARVPASSESAPHVETCGPPPTSDVGRRRRRAASCLGDFLEVQVQASPRRAVSILCVPEPALGDAPGVAEVEVPQ